jgi:hypothetical protein
MSWDCILPLSFLYWVSLQIRSALGQRSIVPGPPSGQDAHVMTLLSECPGKVRAYKPRSARDKDSHILCSPWIRLLCGGSAGAFRLTEFQLALARNALGVLQPRGIIHAGPSFFLRNRVRIPQCVQRAQEPVARIVLYPYQWLITHMKSSLHKALP